MDPQATTYQTNAQTEERSGRRVPGIIRGRVERRIIGAGAKLAIRAGIIVGRFIFTWIIQTVAVWIAILVVSIFTFLIVLFSGV